MSKLDYKSIAIQAGITAVVFALVNKFVNPPEKGLGAAERILLNNFSLERMAQFADAVTIANVNNEAFLSQNFSVIDFDDEETFRTGNKTSIGNCAFVALHTNLAKYKQMALTCIQQYKKIANG